MLNAKFDGNSPCFDPAAISSRMFSQPVPPREVREVDATIVQELNELSVHERNQIYEEVHAIATIQKEPTGPELDQLVSKMQTRVSSIRRKRTAYDKAAFIRPDFVNDRAFQLRFLRSENFDPHKAAQKLIKHFECKRELFGDAKLVEEITLEDLTTEDMECLLSGANQILPTKDSAGRTVMVVNHNYYNFKHWRHLFRVVWYLEHVALEDETMQTQGFVLIIVDIRPHRYEFDFSAIVRNVHWLDGIPSRLSAFHYCHNTPAKNPALQLAQVVVGRHGRLRFRQHLGSYLEVIYALMSFGISPAAIPFTGSGDMKFEGLESFIAERRRIEKERKQAEEVSGIIYPKPNDVIFGKGKPCQEFPGNLQLKSLVDEYRDEYNMSNKPRQKTELTIKVVNRIRATGGRFLRRVDGEWQEIMDDAVARDKVSHSFRIKTVLNASLLDRWTAKAMNNPAPSETDAPKVSISDDFSIVGSVEDQGGPSKRFKLGI